MYCLKAETFCQIQEQLGGLEDGVLVNGDSGNDIELFEVPGARGTMVSNAHPELREWVAANPSDKIFKVRHRPACNEAVRFGPSEAKARKQAGVILYVNAADLKLAMFISNFALR